MKKHKYKSLPADVEPVTEIENGLIKADFSYTVKGFKSVTYNGILVRTDEKFVGVPNHSSWENELGTGKIVLNS